MDQPALWNAGPRAQALSSDARAASAPLTVSSPDHPLLTLSISKMVGFLCGGAALLVVLAWIGYAIRYGMGNKLPDHSLSHSYFIRFNLEAEASFPAWYGSALLLLCAILSAVIATLLRSRRQGLVWYWVGLALIFACLSADEIAVIHELPTGPLRRALDLGGLLWYAWVILGATMVILVGLIYLPFLARLPRATTGRIVTAGAVFVSGSIGLEMIGGAIAEDHGHTDLSYILVMSCEEAAEMTGLILYIRALLLYVRDHVGDVRLSLFPSEWQRATWSE